MLSNEWPLSAKQIHEKLQRQYASNTSYQATHKTLKELEEIKTIIKERKGYKLEIEWIQKSKNLLEKIEKKYLKNDKISIPKNFEGTIEIEFDSFTDVCMSTTELLLSRKLARTEKDKEFICTLEYGWWPFKFKFEHFLLLKKMMDVNPRSKNIIRTKTPFGEWLRNEYNKIKSISAPIGTKIDLEGDVFIQGDSIIQVKFDSQSRKIIETCYKKWKSVEDPFKDFALNPEPKIHATMKITKNPDLAKYLRKQMEKVFEEKE